MRIIHNEEQEKYMTGTLKKEELLQKIQSKTAAVSIIGMGYVGLPMAELAASSGFNVIGIDVDENRVSMINNGCSYIKDIPSEVLEPLVSAGLIEAATDYSRIQGVDIILITVPTPLNNTGDPDMSFVISVLDSIKPYLHEGMLIILESTTYPGTTEDLFLPIITEAGYKEGENIFIAFSPERVDPGNPVYNTKNTPKIVGGLSAAGTEVASVYYRQVLDHVVPVASATSAEMVKLYENTFRAINIGLVNELAIICNLLDVDVWEIIEAAKTKPFGFMPFYPGPGLGGHCIPIDPSYLAWRMKTLQYKTRFIELATEINSQMPEWIITRVMEMLNEEGKALKGANILLLGIAYKNDIDDLRESPAIDLFRLLAKRSANVTYHDPYCPSMQFGDKVVASVPLDENMLQEQDLVLIATGHKEKVDYARVLSNTALVFDTRNITRKIAAKYSAKVVYI